MPRRRPSRAPATLRVPPSLQPPGTVQAGNGHPEEALIGSPMKKARPSIDVGNAAEKLNAAQSLSAALDAAVSGPAVASSSTSTTAPTPPPKIHEIEEEL
ncbi:hypothetical protein E4U53_006733 [Claviceps sorghi]|nr:hypothetical protein E4U53_006733 [Claviceps sorghi]